MGIPVIAGADDWTLAAMRREFGPTLPFMVATEATIADALRALVVSESQRKAYAKRGQLHAERYHAEKPALVRLANLYAKAVETMAERPEQSAAEEFPRTAGTFRTTRERVRVRVANQTYALTAGVDLVIPEPQYAQRLRRIARTKPAYEISEVMA